MLQASIYCVRCKTQHTIKASEIMYLTSVGSAYVCKDCKASK